MRHRLRTICLVIIVLAGCSTTGNIPTSSEISETGTSTTTSNPTSVTETPVGTGTQSHEITVRNWDDRSHLVSIEIRRVDGPQIFQKSNISLDSSEKREYNVDYQNSGNYTLDIKTNSGENASYKFRIAGASPSYVVIASINESGRIGFVKSSA